MIAVINKFSVFAVPLMMFLIIAVGAARKTPVYDTFIRGSEEGMKTVIQIFPILLAILTAAAMLRASGTMDFIVSALAPITDFLHLPKQIIPLALLRPVSGSGSIGLLTDIMNNYGADSFIGRVACTMAGSTETTFYTIAVYFRATQVKYTRHTVLSALAGDFVGLMASVYICNIIFN